MPDDHAITEHAKLLNARRYADYIMGNPSVVEVAKQQLEVDLAGERRTVGHRIWRGVLCLPLDEMLKRMTEDSSAGRLLRSANPFSVLVPRESEQARRLVWRQAKIELSARG